jgi:hypothetical protein
MGLLALWDYDLKIKINFKNYILHYLWNRFNKDTKIEDVDEELKRIYDGKRKNKSSSSNFETFEKYGSSCLELTTRERRTVDLLQLELKDEHKCHQLLNPERCERDWYSRITRNRKTLLTNVS